MRKPNILFITTDQQHPDLYGAAGRYPVKTPNIDRLCREGMQFSRAYTPCPLCTPARASWVTGQYPRRHGAWSIGTTLDENALSVAALLSEQGGYRTAMIGKSHLQSCCTPGLREALPMSQDWEFFKNWTGPWYGFEEARISVGHGTEPHAYCMHYGLWLKENGIPAEPPYFDHPGENSLFWELGKWELSAEFHSSTWTANEAVAYLERHVEGAGDRPFYLNVNFADPHLPFKVPAPWDSMYDDADIPDPVRRLDEADGKPTLYQDTVAKAQRDAEWSEQFPMPCQSADNTTDVALTDKEREIWKTYMGMQSMLDEQLGRILDSLDALGLADNTLVVYSSDHGDFMGNHWLWSKGGSHYDDAVRIPLIVRWPGHVPAGETSGALQSAVDLPVTFMSAAGLEPHPQMQGVDQTASWESSMATVRNGVWIDHRVEAGLSVNSWITDRYRLSVHSIFAEGRHETELYDLQADPNEFENIAEANPDVVRDLTLELMDCQTDSSGPWQSRTAFA